MPARANRARVIRRASEEATAQNRVGARDVSGPALIAPPRSKMTLPAAPRQAPVGVSLTIVPTSVRDCAIPLGGFTNIVVSHYTPRVPGPQGVRKKVRSSPPVLLPRRGEVALPGPGHMCEFSCEASAVLPILAAEPLLVELWHHDKYTKDVLLGVATVDLAEVLSARPGADGPRTSHRQEQSVPFISPSEGMLPAALGSTQQGGRHVAFLDVTVRIEMGPLPPPPGQGGAASGKGRDGRAAAAAKSSCRVGRDGGGGGGCGSSSSGCCSSSSAAAAGRGGGRPPAHPSAERLAQLAAWERKEKERFEKALALKEAERLQKLEREWKVHERQRAAAARQQQRAMEAAAQELKAKLVELCTQEDMLHATAEQLALRHAQMEQRAEVERAALLAAAEKQATELKVQVEDAKRRLELEARVAKQHKERADEMSDRQARAESEANVWKEAHATANARLLTLESDKGKMSAALESERARAATLAEAQKRMQRKADGEKDAAARAAAAAVAAANEFPGKLERIRREAALSPRVAVPLGTRGGAALAEATGTAFAEGGGDSGGDGGDGGGGGGGGGHVPPDLSGEAKEVQQRLKAHAMELNEEARELEEFRRLLESREQLKREAEKANRLAGRAKARTAQLNARSPPKAPPQQQQPQPQQDVTEGDKRAYQLRSLVEGLGSEESWWERYSASYMPQTPAPHTPLVAELE